MSRYAGGAGSDEAEEGDALHRCLFREITTGSMLLSKVRNDLAAVKKLCMGEAKATNEVRKGHFLHFTSPERGFLT